MENYLKVTMKDLNNKSYYTLLDARYGYNEMMMQLSKTFILEDVTIATEKDVRNFYKQKKIKN